MRGSLVCNPYNRIVPVIRSEAGVTSELDEEHECES
jgi:hypothetical protein